MSATTVLLVAIAASTFAGLAVGFVLGVVGEHESNVVKRRELEARFDAELALANRRRELLEEELEDVIHDMRTEKASTGSRRLSRHDPCRRPAGNE